MPYALPLQPICESRGHTVDSSSTFLANAAQVRHHCEKIGAAFRVLVRGTNIEREMKLLIESIERRLRRRPFIGF